MKYFTPKLIERMNDPEMDVIMVALEEREKRLSAYERYLRRIWAKLPQSVRRYLTHCRLHDAQFLGAVGPANGSAKPDHASLLVRQADRLVTLRYELARPFSLKTVLPDKFRSESPLFMYDEMEAAHGGVFVHRILLSSGEELTIRFRKFQVVEERWLLPAEKKELKAVS